MDTVIGRVGGKVIMTFNFTFCNFMFGLLLNNKTAVEASEKIIKLKGLLTANHIRFEDVFPLLLTDNGGERKARLFFCDPMQSSQKPRVEKNHTLFRDIVPKGKSLTISRRTR